MHLDPFGKERNSAGYYANKQGTVPVSPFYKQLDLSIFFRSRVQVASKALQNKHLYTHVRERERGRPGPGTYVNTYIIQYTYSNVQAAFQRYNFSERVKQPWRHHTISSQKTI